MIFLGGRVGAPQCVVSPHVSVRPRETIGSLCHSRGGRARIVIAV